MASSIHTFGMRSAAGFAWLSLALVVGCGGPPATLTGSVTLDGSPVQAGEDINGTIVFQLKGEGGSPATAKIGEDGRYQVATGSALGLAPGEYLVSVSVVRIIPSTQEGSPPWAKKLLPPKYGSVRTSGLSVTVTPGANEYDIALETMGVVSR